MITFFFLPRITEAINDSKDKSKYLESIQSFLLQLQTNCSPNDVIKTIIPGLIRTLKMQDSLSRHYGRSGFLGILLKKVSLFIFIFFQKGWFIIFKIVNPIIVLQK